MIKKLREKKGLSTFVVFPIIAICFFIFSFVWSKYTETRFLMENIRDTMQAESIQNIVSNYANTYHSARESYTTGHLPTGTGFVESYTNDIKENLANELGLEEKSSTLIKVIDERTLYTLSNINIVVDNPTLKSGENLYITTSVDLEIPINIGFVTINFSPTIKVASRYITKF